ncbi:hypothetical protein ACVRZS_00970 [Streptococcus ferus]|uniref:hypothetical protein n=1 Tax=Streptococcus ferus TaxID=1345 RepID=UPI00037EC6BF|nr:hypothetical protein [Streptococcus ferus]
MAIDLFIYDTTIKFETKYFTINYNKRVKTRLVHISHIVLHKGRTALTDRLFRQQLIVAVDDIEFLLPLCLTLEVTLNRQLMPWDRVP